MSNEPFSITLTMDTAIGYGNGDELVSIGDVVLDRVVRNLTERFEADAKQQLHKALADVIREKAEELVTAAVNGPIRKTNSWGEPTGQETTLREMMHEEIHAVLRKSDGHGRDRSKTYLQNVLGGQVAAALDKEFKAALDAGKEEVMAAVKDRATEFIAESLRRAVRL